MRPGERVAVDPRKRDPADFALWKAAGPEEVGWEAPWGYGRPGWHVECSAMSQHYLGNTLDIHGGGIDLIFPHHENEILQSEAASGARPFARYWLHNGHLTIQSEDVADVKMSKSLGNVVRIRDLLDEVPPEALRLLYLDAHYRSPLPYSAARLVEVLAGLERLYVAKEALEEMVAERAEEGVEQLLATFGRAATALHELSTTFAGDFGEAMDDDFNTARALALLFDLARAANRLANDRKARRRCAALGREALVCFALAGRVLGIGGMESAAFFREVKTLRLRSMGRSEADITARVAEREAARVRRDWAAADAIRAELDAIGIVLMDGAEGTHWRVRAV
jgi:cysteinyl-tRNA synthetase